MWHLQLRIAVTEPERKALTFLVKPASLGSSQGLRPAEGLRGLRNGGPCVDTGWDKCAKGDGADGSTVMVNSPCAHRPLLRTCDSAVRTK